MTGITITETTRQSRMVRFLEATFKRRELKHGVSDIYYAAIECLCKLNGYDEKVDTEGDQWIDGLGMNEKEFKGCIDKHLDGVVIPGKTKNRVVYGIFK